MATDIDSLQIQINAQATKANDALDNLIGKLDKLTNSLSRVDGSRLNGLASGVQQLGTAMQTMNAVKTTDFTRLAKNLTSLNNIDTSKLSGVSVNITTIGQSLNGLSGVSKGAQQLAELANGIKQLGYTSADKAITNIPKLATAMKQLMKELAKAPKVSQNLIDMTNALAKLSRTGASSGKATQSLSKAFTSVHNSSSFAVSGIKKINSHLVGLTRSIIPVVSLIGLVDFGKQAMEISSDLTEVQNVVDVTFGDFKQKIEDLASVSIPELGMSELSVKQIGSRFQAMGTAMGFSTEKMSDMSVELTRLTGDMASFYNVSQEDVGKALQSIFTGETEPMRRYGVDLTNATIQQYALSQGITTSVSKMTQLEKATLRYNYVMAQTGASQGDFLRTQDTWANQVRMLKENLKELASIIGGALVNAFKPLIQVLNNVTSQIISFAQIVSDSLGKIFGWKFEIGGGITRDLETGAGSADDIATGVGKAADNAEKLKKQLQGFDRLNVLTTDNGTSNASSGNSNAGGASSGGKWVEQESMFKSFESEIKTLYELGEYIGKALTNAMNSIDWEKVYEKARNFGTGLADFLNGLISPELFGSVGKTIAGALNTAVYAALSFGETFDWEDFGLSIATGINEFFATFDFASLAETINVWVQGIWETIWIAISETNWLDVYDGIVEFLENLDIETISIIIGAITIKNIEKAILSQGIIPWLGTTLSSLIKNVPIILNNVKILAGGGLIAETGFVSKLANALALAAGGAGTLHEALTLTFGSVATTIAGVVAGIGGAVLAVINFFSMWKDGFSWIKEALMVVGTVLAAVGAVILGAPALVAGVVAAIVATVATIAVVIHDNWDSICEFTKNLWNKVQEIFSKLWNGIKNIFSSVANWFDKNVITPVANSFKTACDKIKNFFTGVLDWVKEIPDKFVRCFNSLSGKMKDIGKNVITGFKEGLENAWKSVTSWLSDSAEKVSNTFKKILGIHSPSKVMAELGMYTMEGFSIGLESMYKPILKSLKNFTYNIEVAPNPNHASMLENYQPAYANSYKPSYYDMTYSGVVNQQNSAETNVLLRELLTAVRQGKVIEMNGREVGREIQKQDEVFYKRTGKGMFQH